MSENVLNCSSGDKEKMTAHAAWIDSTKKTVLVLAGVVCVIIAVNYTITEKIKSKLSEIELKHEKELTKLQTETEIRIQKLEEEMTELRKDYRKAERDYNAARVTLHRIRNNK